MFNRADNRCATCHVPPLFTEPGWNLHTPHEIAIDDFQSSRSPDGRYRTTPLRGLFARMKGGFYHDGRFADLDAVIDHYSRVFSFTLTDDERRSLVEPEVAIASGGGSGTNEPGSGRESTVA